MNNNVVLGVDTSNYKTSLAVVRDDEIICDVRKLLHVKKGERGLRQSEALFQHINNLPVLMVKLREDYEGDFDGIAYSDAPRSAEGSYMPCFLAGKSLAESLAKAMKIPVKAFSHQEGHIEAARKGTSIGTYEKFIACHFSGGTTEILEVSPGNAFDVNISGATKDISFGQVIDRAGVAMGMDFPCGEELDAIAVRDGIVTDVLTPVKVSEGMVNLSGIDTQIRRNIDTYGKSISGEILKKLSDAISAMLLQICKASAIDTVLMSGGVSSSEFIRRETQNALRSKGIRLCYGRRELCSDNAVGIAFLGGRFLWE